MMRFFKSVLPVCAALLAASCSSQPAPDQCSTRKTDKIGGPIALTDHTGRKVTEADFKGRKSLVFFGFALCPDVCPTTLYALATALDQLPKGTERPRTILISVDPARDTPQKLGEYIGNDGFPEDVVGLTGDDAAIRAAATAFAADYERVELPDSAAVYTMNHTAIVYLMDEDWKLETFFMPTQTPEEIATCIASLD